MDDFRFLSILMVLCASMLHTPSIQSKCSGATMKRSMMCIQLIAISLHIASLNGFARAYQLRSRWYERTGHYKV